jgi:radical SAM superfamily enzyme YgiQ (UPF0313 family)/uridine kinase
VPREVIQIEAIDFVAKGDAEITLPKVVKVISNGNGDITQVKGLWYRNSQNQPVSTGDAIFPSLEDLPIGIPHIFDKEAWKYDLSSPYFGGEKAWQLFSTRGCSIGCRFCSVSEISGQKIRAMSAERVISEMKYIVKRYNIHNFNFDDDFFTFNIDRARKIAELILESPELCNVRWKITTRADSLPEDLLEIMARAGLVHISLGIESPVSSVLKAIGKDSSAEDYRKVTKLAHKYGIRIRYLLMVGLPEQDSESITSTIDFLKETEPDDIFVAVYVPVPGSEYSNNPEKYGFFPTHIDYKDMIMRDMVMEEKRIRPRIAVANKWMTAEEILEARERIIKEFEIMRTWNIRNLLKDLRSPDMEKRKIAARRLLYMAAPKALSYEVAFKQTMLSLTKKFTEKNRLVVALGGAAGSGKASFFIPHFRQFYSEILSISPDSVVKITDNYCLLPKDERLNSDFLSKFSIEKWFGYIKDLQEGKTIYMTLYDRLSKSRLRVDKEFILDMLDKRKCILEDGTESIYKFQVRDVDLEGQNMTEIYVDINPKNNSLSGKFDILEKINPQNKVIIVSGNISLLDPDVNDGYDERFFFRNTGFQY